MPARSRRDRPQDVFPRSPSSLRRATHRPLSRAQFCLRYKAPLLFDRPQRDIEQFLVHMEQLRLALRFAYHRRQLLLNANHLACMFMRELERFYEFGFRQFVRRAFDHNHIVFGADVNKIEIALGTLRMGRVSDELAVYSAYANGADWTGKWNIRNAQRSGCAVERKNVGIVFTVGAEQNRDDLGVVKIPLWKERPKRPVDHARSERFLFRWAAFTLEIATGKFPHGCRLFAIIDREREIILTFLDNWSRDGTGQHHGIAACDDDCPVGEPRDFAGFD